MTDKELDDLFQHKLSGHQMPVPPDMWQRVNPQKDKRRRAFILWWSGLGMAALFLLVGTATWLYHSSSTEHKQVSATAATSAKEQPANSTAAISRSSNQNGKTTLPKGLSSQETSSQNIAQLHPQSQTIHFNTHQSGYGKNTDATNTGIIQHAAGYKANGTGKAKQHNGIIKNEPDSSHEVSITKNDEPSTPVTAPEANQITQQSDSLSQPGATQPAQTPGNVATATNNAAAQSTKAAAVKVKKIHGEKATSLELMVAGYGNSRHVYDADRFSAAGLVPFGPVSQKEKVLMNSVSISARIDKPLTRNFSLKTGLQFLQTHQQVSYNYETVDQAMFINSISRDTTVLARLQSKQSLVKGTYNSLNVPVLISYHTNGTKLSVGATAGVTLNVLSWYRGSVPDAGNGQTIKAKSAFSRHTGASLYAGLTAAKQLGSFQLFAEPHIQYTLSSVTKSSAPFRQKITGYGFGIGIRKTIGK